MYTLRSFSRVLILVFCLLFLREKTSAQDAVATFAIGDTSFLLNNKPFVVRCGEMHYTRMPREDWRHRLKMAKAMGLNTVCAYLFWNFTERKPGSFNWSGQADAAEFCRMAQQEGLFVILRPGPYSCAEWEFGGFPWWLLKDKSMRVRTQNAHYLEACKRYLTEVGKQLAPLQIDKGGNILMVQVENEYGSFGTDREYIGKIRDFLKEAGFTVPFFTCDGPVQLKNDVRPDIFAAVNFGSNPEAGFKALRSVQAHGPLMCAEYYPGWFDSWGRPHHTGSSQRVIDELKWMLDHNASFSIYMAHGGTTFSTFSGANAPPYLPQTSSYDYDAPINEAGNATPKFYAIRELLGKYLQPGETLPDVPVAAEAQMLNNIRFTASASLWNNLPRAVVADTAMLMEDLDQGYGAVLYETTLAAGGAATIRFEDVHDYAIVYLDKKQVGTIDRRKGNFLLNIPARAKSTTLQILVEATGRVNYGSLMHDRKGIHGAVVLDDGKSKKELKQWKNYSIDLGDKTIPVHYGPISKTPSGAAFYKGSFQVSELKDTYLDLRKWNKGLVWVNGICLGRYWNIGPTQTMYLPGCWLKKGANEVIVFDLLGNHRPELSGLAKPILDSVTEKRAQAHKKVSQNWTLPSSKAWYSGSFENSKEWQTASFKPATARYFCLEALSEFKNQPYTSAAEIQLLDAGGNEIPRSAWKVLYADSEELSGDDGNAANLFDLQFTSIWHTEWQDRSPKLPHQVVIDLGKTYKISGLKLLPRQDNPNGRIKDYRLYFSATPFKGL
ncbi:beta-galactosidase [Niabella hirudinis]|uniref:beta-galactosidase n=1 Tax=Niabella hirudinis TaxID=1285929 RepID=UPI003EBEC330